MSQERLRARMLPPDRYVIVSWEWLIERTPQKDHVKLGALVAYADGVLVCVNYKRQGEMRMIPYGPDHQHGVGTLALASALIPSDWPEEDVTLYVVTVPKRPPENLNEPVDDPKVG